MTKILALAVLAFCLSGCVVASAVGEVAGAGISVAGSVVSTTADVAGGAVDTVAGSGDKTPKN